ncbi:MAG TPA: phage portal protein [Caulobacteraceae bacterium]|nr:phage portal protein [Caulobacteraceae bacterium]
MVTQSGIRVSPEQAMGVPGIGACVQVISEDLAKVPLILYRRTANNGRERAVDHPLYKLLKDRPSPWLTSFAWRRAMLETAALRGNSFSRVYRNEEGMPQQISLPRARSTRVRWAEDGQPFYDIALANGVRSGLGYQDVIHFAYRGSIDHAANGGIFGRSPIDTHREAVALAVAAERYACRFFANGARPSAVVEMDKTFPNDAVANRTRKQVEDVLSGVDNAGRVAIFELGMKLKQWAANNNDAQLVDVRKAAASDMATIFRMPPHKIGILDKATFSNIEQQSIEYVTDNVAPLAAMSEQQLELALLSDLEREIYFIEYDLDGLLRGDIASRYRAYSIGRQWGWLNVDEIRATENKNPLPDNAGQVYLSPMNMNSAKNTADPSIDGPPSGSPGGGADSRNRTGDVLSAYEIAA